MPSTSSWTASACAGTAPTPTGSTAQGRWKKWGPSTQSRVTNLNYAGVIIGPDLRYDPTARRLFIDRDSYRDKKGKENNKKRRIEYTDADLLEFIRNIYGVLLTRGIRGTYVYVCDPALREYVSAALFRS